MRGNEGFCVREKDVLCDEFPIPMRGNETSTRWQSLPHPLLFPIPMRGNEHVPAQMDQDAWIRS